MILLDEATASLDVENETAVQAALSGLIKDKTVLIIAHRMRTVMNADQIVLLSGGRVVEMGSPAELLKKNGLFRHMAQLQSESMELDGVESCGINRIPNAILENKVSKTRRRL